MYHCTHTENDAKQDLLIIDAETGLLSHPNTLECVSPNSGILFPNLFGASSESITLYKVMSVPRAYFSTDETPSLKIIHACWLVVEHLKV